MPLTDVGALFAKDILGNKMSLSISKNKFNGFINRYSYDLDVDNLQLTRKRHIPMNKYKTQTEYLKKKLDAVKTDLCHQHEFLDDFNASTTDDVLKSLESA